MAKKIVTIIKSCAGCPHQRHNGRLQANPKCICEHEKVFGKGTVKASYWYNNPVITDFKTIDELYCGSLNNVEIPEWCPLEDYDGD